MLYPSGMRFFRKFRGENEDRGRDRERLRRYEDLYGKLPEGAGFTRLEGRLVWILGSPRTGSTYLAGMLAEALDSVVWNEPLVGRLFGDLYYRGPMRRGRRFILGRPEALRRQVVRTLILQSVIGKFPRLGDGQHVIIKEPNGSIGAPILMDALPESRMIFLFRDPRDIRASGLAATSEGGFQSESHRERRASGEMNVSPEPASVPFFNLRQSKLAFESHSGPKVMVSYEALRADAAGELERVISALGLAVEADVAGEVAEKHSWDSVPGSEKGEKSKKRSATPGGWRRDLTETQIRKVEEQAGDLMDALGYERAYPDPEAPE